MSLSVSFRHRFTSLELQIEFEAPTPGVVAFFGPSGCGKSTVVMAAAGLLQPDTCRIDLDGTTLTDSANGVSLPPEKRRIGLVFQDARLFPHMSVRSNLRFGMRRAPRGPIRLDDVVDLLGIGHLLDRRPRSLSGGERQRVAIGRALLSQPKLLAMDEPLASLDGPRKAEILPFLARLKTALALPILYVTHSPEELASLADTLVLLDVGRVVAAGPLEQLMTRSDLPLAKRDDAGAVFTARVVAQDAGRQLTALETGGIRLWVPLIEREPGAMLRVRVPAREVILAGEQPGVTSAHNVIPGRVRAITHEPNLHETEVEIALDGGALLARVTPDAVDLLRLAPGREVVALVKSVSIEILPG
jgi:molybdate transport system ATP-binding protein